MVYSEENSSKFNVYSGMFDFSDTGKKSTLIGFQHQNEDLNRDTFLGNISPITGAISDCGLCCIYLYRYSSYNIS